MSFHGNQSTYQNSTALRRLDPELLKLKAVVDPATARRQLAALDGALIHAMPTGEPNCFAMLGFTYEPAFTVVPLELVTPDGRHPLSDKRGLRPSSVYPYFAEIVAPRPLRNIRDAFDLARSWVDTVLLGKPGFIG